MAIDFEISSWGSCRYSDVKVLYPEQINLKNYTENPGTQEVDLGFMKFIYENHDSRKNYHRKIEITEVKEPVIIRNYGNFSCSRSFDHVYLITPDLQMQELPIKSELKRNVLSPDGKYIRDIEVNYTEYEGNKIILGEHVVEEKPNISSMVVNIEVKGDKLEVKGDTYQFRNILKNLGLKWESLGKYWYTTADKLNAVVEGLRNAGVNVTVVGGKEQELLKEFEDFIGKNTNEDKETEIQLPAELLENVLSRNGFTKFYSSGNESAFLKGDIIVSLRSDGQKTDVEMFKGVYTAEHKGKIYEIIVLRNPDIIQYYAIYPQYNPSNALIVENDDEGMGIAKASIDVRNVDLFIKSLPAEGKDKIIVPFPVKDFFNIDNFIEVRKELGFRGIIDLILSDSRLRSNQIAEQLRKYYLNEENINKEKLSV